MAEPTPCMIPRFVWDQDDEDEFCIDRLNGQTVVRYDLGDPVNYAKSHGGWSKREWLEKKGHDPDAEIDISASMMPVPPGEAERHAAARARRAEREREEDEARDLMEFLGAEAERFSFDRYAEGERTILRPALERRGFTNVGFYMGEEDSFGPLSRGCVATDPDGKRVRFFYG